MIKYVLLILITSMIWIPSLGQDIKNSTKNDTTINLPKSVGKEAVKDIIKGDSAIAELEATKKILEKTQNNISLKDSIIASKTSIIDLYKKKEDSYNVILGFKDQQLDKYKTLSDQLAKDLKKSRRTKTFHDIAGSGIILFLSYLILKK